MGFLKRIYFDFVHKTDSTYSGNVRVQNIEKIGKNEKCIHRILAFLKLRLNNEFVATYPLGIVDLLFYVI